MSHRLLKLMSRGWQGVVHTSHFNSTADDVVWAMGSFCALNRKPFDAGMLLKQFYSADSFIHAARAMGFCIKRRDCDSAGLVKLNFPCLAILREAATCLKLSVSALRIYLVRNIIFKRKLF